MFSRQSCYFFVRPKKSFLEVCVFLGRSLKAPQVRRVDRVSKSKVAHFIHITHRDEVEAPVTDWLRDAYELLGPAGPESPENNDGPESKEGPDGPREGGARVPQPPEENGEGRAKKDDRTKSQAAVTGRAAARRLFPTCRRTPVAAASGRASASASWRS